MLRFKTLQSQFTLFLNLLNLISNHTMISRQRKQSYLEYMFLFSLFSPPSTTINNNNLIEVIITSKMDNSCSLLLALLLTIFHLSIYLFPIAARKTLLSGKSDNVTFLLKTFPYFLIMLRINYSVLFSLQVTTWPYPSFLHVPVFYNFISFLLHSSHNVFLAIP